MTTQVIVDSRSQVSAPQIWDTPTAAAQVGDYIRVPFVPVMLVADRDVLEDGRVWLLVKPVTGSYSEEWVLEPESPVETQQPATETQQQPAGFAGDSVACQMRPAPETNLEFKRGRIHGQNDAKSGRHPIYTQPLTEYATGYLAGYNAVLNPTTAHSAPRKPLEWSVTYNSQWQWYEAWVSSRWTGQASTAGDAEALAQRYIAVDEMIQRQNRAVLRAYADV